MIPVSLGKRARIAQALETLRKTINGPGLITESVDPEIYNIPRNLDIFPGALGSYQQSKQALEQPLHYTLTQLKCLFQRSNREEDHIENIYVSSAEYCKETGEAKHEFLLLEVKDERIPLISNWVVLDRTVQASNSGTFSALSTSVSSGAPAQDRLRVSCYGRKDLLTKQCNLTPYDVIERVTLPLSNPLLLCDLVILALETSKSRFMYNLMSAQCFWFASCVWECMLKLRPETYRPAVAESNNRGRFGKFFRQDVDNLELEDILYKARSEIQSFRMELTRGKEAYGRAKLNVVAVKNLQVKEENERMMAEIKRLRDTAGRGAQARDAYLQNAPPQNVSLRNTLAGDMPMRDAPIRDAHIQVTRWGLMAG